MTKQTKTKQTKKADKPSKAGAVKLTEDRLDAASGGTDGSHHGEIELLTWSSGIQKPVPPRIR